MVRVVYSINIIFWPIFLFLQPVEVFFVRLRKLWVHLYPHKSFPLRLVGSADGLDLEDLVTGSTTSSNFEVSDYEGDCDESESEADSTTSCDDRWGFRLPKLSFEYPCYRLNCSILSSILIQLLMLSVELLLSLPVTYNSPLDPAPARVPPQTGTLSPSCTLPLVTALSLPSGDPDTSQRHTTPPTP